MLYTTIHAKTGKEIRQLLALIDVLEEHHFGEADNEHRYAGVKSEGKDGRYISFVTPIPVADLMVHFKKTGAATAHLKAGQLHLTYTSEADPLDYNRIGPSEFLPSVMAQPF